MYRSRNIFLATFAALGSSVGIEVLFECGVLDGQVRHDVALIDQAMWWRELWFDGIAVLSVLLAAWVVAVWYVKTRPQGSLARLNAVSASALPRRFGGALGMLWIFAGMSLVSAVMLWSVQG